MLREAEASKFALNLFKPPQTQENGTDGESTFLFDDSTKIRPNCCTPTHRNEVPNSLLLELAQPSLEQYLHTHIIMAKKEDSSVRENYVPPQNTVRTHRVLVSHKSKIKQQSLFDELCAWVVGHQVGVYWHTIFV